MAFVTILSGMLLLKSFFRSKKEADHRVCITQRNWLYICLVSVFLFICLAVIKCVGFIPGGILIIASFMFYMGERKILTILLVSVLAPALIYTIIFGIFHQSILHYS